MRTIGATVLAFSLIAWGVPGLLADTPAPKTAEEAQTGRVDLRPKFKVGTTAKYVMEIESKGTTKSDDLGDLAGDQTMSQRIDLTMRVKEATEKGSIVELVYERIKIRMKMADMDEEYDSAAPARPNRKGRGNDPLANLADGSLLEQIVKPMVGTRLTLTVDPSGNIIKVSGGEALSGNGLQGLGGLPGLGSGPAVPGSGGSAAGLEWLVGGSRQSGFARVGESWTNTDSLGSTPIGALEMTTRHTLRSHRAGVAEVAFSGQAKAPTEGGAAGGLFELRDATYGGAYSWDTEQGMLRDMQSNLETRIKGKVGEAEIELSSGTTMRVRRERGG